MHELVLAVNLTGWRNFVRRKMDKASQSLLKSILVRDAYTCQYCGFQAQEFQDVVNLDGNYANNKPQNLITACCFCSQCLFLQAVGIDDLGGGQLIYLPEMSQADLNSFCHVLFCAIDNNSGYQDTAQAVYRSYKFRSQVIENKIGTGTSNPAVFGQMMIEYQREHPKKKFELLKDIRLLPSQAKFRMQLDVWAASAAKEAASAPSEAAGEQPST